MQNKDTKEFSVPILKIDPMPKPRMTQSDRWRKRPAVLKYFAWCDELRLLCAREKFSLGESLRVTFIIPMPESWSEKKKKKMDFTFHRQKPDLDNLIKSVQDALLGDDSKICEYRYCAKVWGYEGQIQIISEEL